MEILQVAQRAIDLDRAVSFYENLLGQAVAARFDPPGLAFFTLGDVRLLLDRGAPSSLVYLRVHDVAALTERLRSEGVEVVAEPRIIFSHPDETLGPAGMDEWMAFILDSEGNTVGLVGYTAA